MRRCLAALLLLGGATPAAAQAPLLPPARTIFQVTPLGLLQFGPTLEVQQFVAPQIALTGSLRFVTAGVLAHLMANADNDGLGMAWTVGGNALYYVEPGARGWYFGPRVEWGKADTDLGESTLFAITGEGGYRFRRPSGFTYSFGLMAGTITDDFTGDDPFDSNKERLAFGALVITLGKAR